MVKSLFKLFGKSSKDNEPLTQLDITRVVGPSDDAKQREPAAADSKPAVDLDVWKKNDIELLQTTWQACCDQPGHHESEKAFRNALHNLHGASGAYGGKALTRLTGSLQTLVSGSQFLEDEAALINLHVQACRAAALDTSSAEEVSNAVCDALEEQVQTRLVS